MAKDDIPIKESTNRGVPFDGSVRGAEEALRGIMSNPEKETATEDQEQTEATEDVSAQDMESESVQTEAQNPDGLTADDIVDDNQEENLEKTDTYTIKVDGEQVEVTLEELQAGYRRQADYSRNSQVLAEKRKQADEELAATQQERQRYLSQLEQFNTQADAKMEELKATDWTKLKEEDLTEYMLKRDQYRELQENKRMVEDEQKNLVQKQQQEQQAKWNEELSRQQQLMAQRLPEWNDPDKGQKIKQSIKSYALKTGFTEQEVNSLIDARSVDVLHKAMLYDNLLAAKISNKKTKVVPKVTRPGSPATKGEISGDKVKAQRARLRKTGHVKDASSLLESILNS
tara:strand:+ start:1673 stop:2704 length:1032 start_codon:yes stop_codon:yes gene_type:complete